MLLRSHSIVCIAQNKAGSSGSGIVFLPEGDEQDVAEQASSSKDVEGASETQLAGDKSCEAKKSFEVQALSELETLQTLGKGSSGVVQLARHITTDRLVALKVSSLSPKAVRFVLILAFLLGYSNRPQRKERQSSFDRALDFTQIILPIHCVVPRCILSREGHFTRPGVHGRGAFVSRPQAAPFPFHRREICSEDRRAFVIWTSIPAH